MFMNFSSLLCLAYVFVFKKLLVTYNYKQIMTSMGKKGHTELAQC